MLFTILFLTIIFTRFIPSFKLVGTKDSGTVCYVFPLHKSFEVIQV
ncbi:hypothetical protein HanXRQr2_Chr01g0005111 [Helianthus annuus]|uniref:Uncharacterized protein n=1 Tax=Helianthus annuus TaxID=4232 RepID=A0A9K3P1U0_HELAN|nr:hypothetical protein HanXRQr2_Chr01g0005111 [Helianthus annuus]